MLHLGAVEELVVQRAVDRDRGGRVAVLQSPVDRGAAPELDLAGQLLSPVELDAVGLGEILRLNERAKGRTRVLAEDVDLAPGALVKPRLQISCGISPVASSLAESGSPRSSAIRMSVYVIRDGRWGTDCMRRRNAP